MRCLLNKIYSSVALKVFIPQIFIIILSLIVVIIVALVGINSLTNQTIHMEIEKAKTVASIEVKNRLLLITSNVNTLANNQTLAEAVANKDYDVVQSYVDGVKKSFDEIRRTYDPNAKESTINIRITDARGIVIASSASYNRRGQDHSNRWSFKKMSPTSGYLSTIDWGAPGILVRSMSPIVLDGKMVGTIEGLENINDTLAGFAARNNYKFLVALDSDIKGDATAIKEKHEFNGDLIVNPEAVMKEVQLLDGVKKAGLNKDVTYLRTMNHFFMPIPLETSPKTTGVNTGEVNSRHVGTIYFATPEVSIFKIVDNATMIAIELLVVFIVAFIASTVLIMVFLVMNVIRPLRKLAVALRDLSEGDGDLRVRLSDSKVDEFGRAAKYVDKFIEKIQDTVITAIDTSTETSSSSEELSSTAMELSNNITEQLSLVDDTEKLIGDIGKNLDITEERAISTTEDLEQTKVILDRFVASLSSLVDRVNNENEQQKNVSDKMNEVTDRVKEITAVLTIISEIADQTNLLALNASIEAARAGEHGKGFAVVADEVRKLAERTQDSLDNINKMAKMIMQSVDEAYNLVEQSSTGIKYVAEAAGSLILEGNETAQRLTTSTEVSSDVVHKTSYIAVKVKNLIEVSHQLVSLSSSNQVAGENVRTVSEHLANRSTELKRVLSKFQV